MKRLSLVLMVVLLAAVVTTPVQAMVLDSMTLGATVDTPPRDGAPGRWWDLRGMEPNPALKESAFSHDGDGSMMIDYSYNITETLDDDPPGSIFDREVSGLFEAGVYAPAMPDLSLDEYTPGTPNPNLAFSFWVHTAGASAAEHLRELQVYDSEGARALYVVSAWDSAPLPSGWRFVVAPLTSLSPEGTMDWSRVNEIKFFFSAWISDGEDQVPVSGSPVYVDDFRLIPEPATIAMLSLGGLALLRRRKA